MARITVTKTINAPLHVVFATVADIRQFAEAIPHIVGYEFLSETQTGVGTRFRETRVMHGKEASTVLEVTEYVENQRTRLVADSHGTVWDSVFEVREEGGATVLTLTMDAKAYKLLPKLMNPLICGMIRESGGQGHGAGQSILRAVILAEP